MKNIFNLKEEFRSYLKDLLWKNHTISTYLSIINYCYDNNWITDENSLNNIDIILNKFDDTINTRKKYLTPKDRYTFKSVLNKYAEFLNSENSLVNDISNIKQNKKLSDTEKKQWINARIGQGTFREDVLELNKGECCVTGINIRSVLVASHIKPWGKCANAVERLDKYNALLLSSNLDKLFDKFLISFNENGEIIFSKNLKDYEQLGLSKETKIKLHKDSIRYIAYHRGILENNNTL